MYYDGSSMIFMNGDLLGQASQFSLKDLELVTATVNLVLVPLLLLLPPLCYFFLRPNNMLRCRYCQHRAG